MNKMRVLQAVSDAGLIALVRAETKEQALAMSEALIAGGVTVIEDSYGRSPNNRSATSVISSTRPMGSKSPFPLPAFSALHLRRGTDGQDP